MKKQVFVFLTVSVLLLAFLSGCAKEGSASKGKKSSNSVEQVIVKQINEYDGNGEEEETTQSVTPPPPEKADADLTATEGVDVDLTILSGTMLFSQVSYMMERPEEYIGKVIRVPGVFNVEYSADRTQIYYGCLVYDKSACCTLGVEFDMPETLSYPEDFPEINAPITVQGSFDTYKEDGYTYCVLRNAKMVA